MIKISFIGLGVMGSPMAGHLVKAGQQVTVFNRSPEKSAQWQQRHDGQTAPSLQQAVQDADFVISCVSNDQSLQDITLGQDGSQQGAFSAMKQGAIFIDHSTTSAHIARTLYAQAQQRGLHFIDAPVSGGEVGAQTGQLTVMCGGDEDIYQHAAPIIAAYAKACSYLGASGAGQLCKMVNQICVAGLLQGLSEGLLFSEKAGLDSLKVMEVIGQGAAQSWQMDNRHKTMIAGDYDFGFAVDLMRKDLGICLEEAQRSDSPLPITKQIDGYYKQVQQMGGSRWDTSSLLARLKQQDK